MKFIPPILLVFSLGGSLASGQGSNLPRLVPIPAGQFLMGSEDGANWEKPEHPVVVPAFEIGIRSVSNAEFRAFRPTHRSPKDNSDDAPVTGVSWLDANLYCEWLSTKFGKTIELPSEARWERAIRGGKEQRKYPWGHDPAPGQVPPNPYGVIGVANNLWEWTADWYADDYYASPPAEDPRGPAEGEHRVLRGGGFFGQPETATCYSRGSARPETRADRITFRVSHSEAGQQLPQVSELGPRPQAEASQPQPAAAQPEPSQPAARPSASARREPTKTAAPILTLGEAPASTEAPKRPEPIPAAPSASGLSTITKIEVVDDGSGLAIVLTADNAAEVKGFRLDGPPRLVLDLDQCKIRGIPLVGEVAAGRKGVQKVRYSQRTLDPPSVRLVSDLESAVDYSFEASAGRTVIKLRAR